ncbi:MAG: cytochrome-c peroxidase [Saprospiraceae bacterium]
MKIRFDHLTFLAVLGLFAASCNEPFDYNYYSEDDYAKIAEKLNLPNAPVIYRLELPQHLRNAGLSTLPVDGPKATLGRVLFYDKSLSADGTVSCASCHKQQIAFADDRAVSVGVNGQNGTRNSIALGSVLAFTAYYGTDLFGASAVPFFWDNRAGTARQQNMASLTNPVEMGLHDAQIAEIVKSKPYYPPLFRAAYGDDGPITTQRVSEAIAEFINAMGSFNSKLDKAVEATASASGGFVDWESQSLNYVGLNAQENQGRRIFSQHCASCHTTIQSRPMLLHANNGLDAQTTDAGVGGLSGKSSEIGSFKVPLLRNIALTAPYMHDGRFKTLEEVVEFYNSGIQPHPNLHQRLKQGNQPKRLNLSQSDKAALVAFLHTMTDPAFVSDPRYSDPFKY